MYNKLFTKILDSSVWLAPDPHRLVWITLIAAMDQDSFAAFACIENLALRARVSVEDTAAAVAAFEAPDPYDSEQEHEGRRIERVQGGWLILNGDKYRKTVTRAVASEQSRLRMQRFRERQRSASVTQRNVTQPLRRVTPSVSVSYAVSVSDSKNSRAVAPPDQPTDDEWLADLKANYPKRAGDQRWRAALKASHARMREGHTRAEMLAGAIRYAEFIRATGKEHTEYVKQAATFFGPEKPFLLPWNRPAEPETAMDEIRRLNGGHDGRTFDASPAAVGALSGTVRR